MPAGCHTINPTQYTHILIRTVLTVTVPLFDSICLHFRNDSKCMMVYELSENANCEDLGGNRYIKHHAYISHYSTAYWITYMHLYIQNFIINIYMLS